MAQSHNAFAIARVRPHNDSQPKYRCIAAFRHDRCYGHLPLKATRRFLTLAKQKDNAEIIRSELRNIQGKNGRHPPEILQIPCPYTAFLLATSWAVDLGPAEQRYITSGVDFLDAVCDTSSRSRSWNNTDGISVIDVTDPVSPSYCFVYFNASRDGRGLNIPSYTPLSATDYARIYYPSPVAKDVECAYTTSREKDPLAVVGLLDDERLVDLWVLAETWPDEYTVPEGQRRSGPQESSALAIRSSAELAIELTVRHALNSGETAIVEELLYELDYAENIRPILSEQSPFQDAYLPLLAKLMKKGSKSDTTPVWDLSQYALSSEQIIGLIETDKDIEELNLSNNPFVTLYTIRKVLVTLRRLKRLVLLDCPSLSDTDIYELLVDEPQVTHNLDALVHPALLQASEEALYHNSFSFVAATKGMAISSCSMPLFTPSLIVRSLTDLLGAVSEASDNSVDEAFDGSLVLQAAFSAAEREAGQKWGTRRVVSFPQSIRGNVCGEGWVFSCDFRNPRNQVAHFVYGFMRFLPRGRGQLSAEDNKIEESPTEPPPGELHDLRSFLKQVTQEGRPAVPEEAITELEEVIKVMERKQVARFMTTADMDSLINFATEKGKAPRRRNVRTM